MFFIRAFSGGRKACLFCCLFLFSEVFASVSENEILAFKKSEFSASKLNAKISRKITEFANNGYPLARISPQISETEDSIFINLSVNRGFLIENAEPRFIIDGNLREHLVRKPIGRILERSSGGVYNHSDFLRAENILRNKKYIDNVQLFSPEIRDTIPQIPILIEPFNSVLFDGAVAVATFPKTQVSGRANLAAVNILGFGEVLDFSYIGEELFYRIGGDLEIPYFLKTPFSLLFSASAEIADTLYGTVSLSVGAGYFFGDFWTARLLAEYSEITIHDTITRYSGMKISLDNGRRRFNRAQFATEYEFSARSGIVISRDEQNQKGEFLAKTTLHIPFAESRFAVLTKPNLGTIAFATPQTLHKTQLFRLGGANSVRGYQESSFSALAFGSLGNEFRYYIADFSSIYILGDYAAFLNNRYSLSNIEHLFGYGLGISLPVRRLTFSLEWARHINDFSDLGRLHFRLSNF